MNNVDFNKILVENPQLDKDRIEALIKLRHRLQGDQRTKYRLEPAFGALASATSNGPRRSL
jgi:hypothetical protein